VFDKENASSPFGKSGAKSADAVPLGLCGGLPLSPSAAAHASPGQGLTLVHVRAQLELLQDTLMS